MSSPETPQAVILEEIKKDIGGPYKSLVGDGGNNVTKTTATLLNILIELRKLNENLRPATSASGGRKPSARKVKESK